MRKKREPGDLLQLRGAADVILERMCGRYNIVSDPQALMDAFGVIDVETSVDVVDRYNIAPSEPSPKGESTRERRMIRVPTIRLNDERRVMRSAIWPLIPVWARGVVPKYATANARCETMAKLSAYRDAWSTDRRCLVPATSFVEWQTVVGSRRKQPWLVYLADRRPMAFAGLWEVSHAEDGERIESCTIVTAPANALMAEIHNTRKRMPVVLEDDPNRTPGCPARKRRSWRSQNRWRTGCSMPIRLRQGSTIPMPAIRNCWNRYPHHKASATSQRKSAHGPG